MLGEESATPSVSALELIPLETRPRRETGHVLILRGLALGGKAISTQPQKAHCHGRARCLPGDYQPHVRKIQTKPSH
jgi:hypothetical protein